MKKIKLLPFFSALLLLTVCTFAAAAGQEELIELAEEFAGKKIGVVTGTICDQYQMQYLPDAATEYLNSNTDLAVALEIGKIDGYMTDEPLARILCNQYPGHLIRANLFETSYGYIFQKDDPESDRILGQLNGYLKKIKADGTLSEIDKIWFGSDLSVQTVDYANLSAENGILRLAVASDIGAPFVYIQNGEYAGYDVDIAVRFCREYGYGIEIVDSAFASLIANVSTGKCDFGASCITITDERKESMNFSEPNYEGGFVLVVRDGDSAPESSRSFIASVCESFEKTFIRENRWKLFLEGIGVTLLITVLSALLGFALGFAVYLLYRRQYRVFNVIIDVIVDILGKTPMVVILMILYYILFGRTTIDAMWVSVVGFALTFACGILSLLKTSANAIDRGQTEAALALGYTETQSFLRVVLPQAMKYFFPGFQGELVTLIKGTAVVGYISVQDLTRVSDIVRSRTYEAFFPLIVTAVIYFAIARLLTFLVRRIEFAADPRHRPAEQILKGVTRT